MKELYTGGAAIHSGPESCVGVREDVGEALAGVVRAGLLSRENQMKFGVPTSSHQAEGHVVGGVIASVTPRPIRCLKFVPKFHFQALTFIGRPERASATAVVRRSLAVERRSLSSSSWVSRTRVTGNRRLGRRGDSAFRAGLAVTPRAIGAGSAWCGSEASACGAARAYSARPTDASTSARLA